MNDTPTRELANVRRAANNAVAAAKLRDLMIREAHKAGSSIRAIAAEAGISSARVHQILHEK